MADVKTKDTHSAEFEDYRRKMHPEEEAGRPVVPAPRKAVAIGFGIFMIIVYVGVGVLFLINFFNWDSSWTWARYVVGIVLIIYGIFRAYRQFSGSDYYSK